MFRKYVASTYEITDTYERVLIDDKSAKVKIEPSDDGVTRMFFFENKKNPYVFCIRDGELAIKPKRLRWHNFLIIGIHRSEIRLCVPESMLDAISVTSSVGSVDIYSIKCNGSINIMTNTGSVSLKDVSCRTFESIGNTGSVLLNNFTAGEGISVKRNTGKVALNDCFAPEIYVKTNTGRVTGRLPSGTVFTASTNTGRVEVPSAPIGSVVGSRCKIKTNTGSIKFE